LFHFSPPDSGFSIDNIPPPPPQLVLTEDLDSRVLSWTNPGVDDLDVSCLYRKDELGSLPDTLLVCTDGTSWVETHQFYYSYYAQAVDIHGNAGGFSNQVEYEYPTPVNDALPAVPRLSANVPNPFNPGTRISFTLPRAMEARLAIYSLDGKIVTTLASGYLEAGAHEFSWNGRDRANRIVPAGVYFYQLGSGGFKETRSMTLLK
jgi:hypothetical protein